MKSKPETSRRNGRNGSKAGGQEGQTQREALDGKDWRISPPHPSSPSGFGSTPLAAYPFRHHPFAFDPFSMLPFATPNSPPTLSPPTPKAILTYLLIAVGDPPWYVASLGRCLLYSFEGYALLHFFNHSNRRTMVWSHLPSIFCNSLRKRF